MIQLVQTRTGSPNGNCMATSLASILETRVPEFGVNVDDDEFYANMAGWLADQGYGYHERPVAGARPKGYHLILGVSPRGGRHAIVGEDGKPVWDPHPEDGTGRLLASRDAFGILIPLEERGLAHDVDSLSLDEWEESKHPRAASGKFGSGSSENKAPKGGREKRAMEILERRYREADDAMLKAKNRKDYREAAERKQDYRRQIHKLKNDGLVSREIWKQVSDSRGRGRDSMAQGSEVPQEYRELMLPIEFRTGTCPACGNEATLNMDGTVAEHGTCGGWGLPPTLGDYDNPGRAEDSWKSLVEKLERKGYSKHYANAIAGKVNKEKFPPSGKHADDDFDGLSLDAFEESKHPRGRHADDEHLGFEKLEGELAHRKGVTDPGGLAAYIGRKKLGKKAFQKKAAAGRRKH